MKRNKSDSIKSIIAIGIGAFAALWLSSKPNRIKAESKFKDIWLSSEPKRMKAETKLKDIWLSSKPKIIVAKSSLREFKRKIKPTALDKSKNFPIKKGGFPDPNDLEDNNMVSEGALYSVKFYNEKLQ